MKRRNVESSTGKLRRAAKRSKLNDGSSSFGVFVNFKFLFVWILVIILDFISEFRFELLYPFWVFICNISETFRYKGISYLFSYVFITITIDMFCYYIIPIHWLFFASSTYVWIQFTWYSERGITLFSILVWISLIFMEAFVRLRELKSLPFQFEICRPFAAHGVGYPILLFGIGCKSYVHYRLLLNKKRIVAKENEFYYSLLQKALVNPAPNSLISNNNTTNTNNLPATIDYQQQTLLSFSTVTGAQNLTISTSILPVTSTQMNNNNEASSSSSSSSSSPLRASTNNSNSISFAQSNGTNKIVPTSTATTTTSLSNSRRNSFNNNKLNTDLKILINKLKIYSRSFGTTKISYLGQKLKYSIWKFLQFYQSLIIFIFSIFSPKVLLYYVSMISGKLARIKLKNADSNNTEKKFITDLSNASKQLIEMDLNENQSDNETSFNESDSNKNRSNHSSSKTHSTKQQTDTSSQNGFVKKSNYLNRTNDVINIKNQSTSSIKQEPTSDLSASLNLKFLQSAETKLLPYLEEKQQHISPEHEDFDEISFKRITNTSSDVQMYSTTKVDQNVANASSSSSSLSSTTNSKTTNSKDQLITSNSNKGSTKKNKSSNSHRSNNQLEHHAYLLELIKEKDNQIWKVELDNQRLKSDLQTIRQCESDLRKQMDIFKNDEKVFKNSISNYQNDIEHLQKKLQNYLNAKQQDKQTIQKLEKQLDDEKRKSKASIELQAASEKKARLAEENAARATAIAAVAASRNICSESCLNKQHEYEHELINLRKELQIKDEQLRLKELLLGEYKDIKNKGNMLMSTLAVIHEKNVQLEESLKLEKVLKMELYLTLEEAKRQINKQRMMCMDYEKEIRELKGKLFMNTSKLTPLMASNTPCLNLNGFSSSSSPSTSSDIELVNRCFSSCSPNTAASSSSLSSNTPPLTGAGQPLVERSFCNVSPGPNSSSNSSNNNNNNNTKASNFMLATNLQDAFSLDHCLNWNPLKRTLVTLSNCSESSTSISTTNKSTTELMVGNSVVGVGNSIISQPQQSNCTVTLKLQQSNSPIPSSCNGTQNNAVNNNHNTKTTSDLTFDSNLKTNNCNIGGDLTTNNIPFNNRFEL